MVVVRLLGGLGNQLFQYAAGRAVAHRHGTELKLDVSAFEQYRKRTYGLAPFAITASIATQADVRQLTTRRFPQVPDRVDRLLRHMRLLPSRSVLTERHFSYDPSIREVGANVYLSGFWQSPRYFDDISDIVREEFAVVKPPDDLNQSYLQQITRANSVSLHVRRGDLVTGPEAPDLHYAMDLAYYYRAVEYISRRVSKPSFFVFSDDIDWVQEHLRIDHPVTFVGHNDAESDYEDLRLMRHCKHHIIANSTFSWWGAWLSGHRDKIVVAPRDWFKKTDPPTDDLVPPDWSRL